ncbi:hypothetical protein [Aureivirga marina]|uniref:hypothetical protein n=1 Tax=Aureivirga marina TaxID=1182451 RepID=UPI0018C9F1EF|nr:hypothetical protein [Aureivirga marina]
MASSTFLNKLFKATFIVVILLLFLSYISSIFLEKELQDFLQKKVEVFNKTSSYQVSFEKINLSFINRKVTLKEIKVIPTDSYISLLKEGKVNKSVAYYVEIPKLEIRGFEMYNYFKNKIAKTSAIRIEHPKIKIKHFKNIERYSHEESIKEIALNVKGLHGLTIDHILFLENDITVEKAEDSKSNKTKISPFDILIHDVSFAKEKEGKLVLKSTETCIEIPKFTMTAFNDLYDFSFHEMKYDLFQKNLKVHSVIYKPTNLNLLQLSETYKYTKDVFSLEEMDLEATNFDLIHTLKFDEIVMDSLMLKNVKASILKNKTKPWNYKKRPLFPNQLLNSLKTPIKVNDLVLNHVDLLYREKLKNADENLKVTFKEGEIVVKNIASNYYRNKNPLELKFKGKFMGSSTLHLNIKMNYFSPTFHFNGSMSKAPLTDFNKALFPATGISFKKGSLEKVSLMAIATPESSAGEMVLEYKNADFVFHKKKNGGENDLKSFFGNLIVDKNNPDKEGKIKKVPMKFDRVPYKGLGNFVWKTAESGIKNTFFIFGKKEK